MFSTTVKPWQLASLLFLPDVSVRPRHFPWRAEAALKANAITTGFGRSGA
jgi:hypothetical protein